MSTREDLEADARHEMETEEQYFYHENFHTTDPVKGCWLCDRDLQEGEQALVEANEEAKLRSSGIEL